MNISFKINTNNIFSNLQLFKLMVINKCQKLIRRDLPSSKQKILLGLFLAGAVHGIGFVNHPSAGC